MEFIHWTVLCFTIALATYIGKLIYTKGTTVKSYVAGGITVKTKDGKVRTFKDAFRVRESFSTEFLGFTNRDSRKTSYIKLSDIVYFWNDSGAVRDTRREANVQIEFNDMAENISTSLIYIPKIKWLTDSYDSETGFTKFNLGNKSALYINDTYVKSIIRTDMVN